MPTSNFLSKNDFLQALRERVDVSKALLSEMFDILPYLRKWGMLVAVYNDTDPINNGLYMLKRNKASNIISDNANWDKVDAYPRISGIISGGNVSWTGEGLIFQVGITEYIIDTNYYVLAAPVLVELEHSDPDYPRFDTFYVDINGNAGVITGTPAADPSIPSVDTNTQIYLTSVLVGAGAIIPNIDTLIVYNENTEWTGSTQNNITANFNATNNPSKGIKNVEVTNIYRYGTITFSGEAMKLSDYTSIELDICLKEVMKSTQYLYIRVLLNNASKCAYKILNISKLYLGYQTIIVPISTLGATADEINQVRFMWVDSVANELIPHAGFDLDYVRFTGGINPPALLDTIELIGDVLADGVVGSPVIVRLNPESTQTSLSLTDKLYLKTNLGLLRDITWENILKQVVITTDGTTITGTGTTTDPVKSNVYNADEAGINLPQRSRIQGGEYIEYTDDDVNEKTLVDIKPDKLEEATELESEVIELEQADELESETFLNPDWEETDPTKISYIQNKPTLSGSLWENDEFKMVGYGYLYNWFVTSNIANGNWRVPTWAEATELQTYLLTEYGVNDHEAYLMLAISDSSFWNNTDVRTNNFNFNAIAAGYRANDFGEINEELRAWTQTEANDTYSRTLVIDRAEPGWPLRLGTYASFKRNGASIKLIRNASTSELLLEDGTYVDDYIGNDGRKYKSIKLGNYVWLSENLCETLYNDLTPIINVTDQTEWDALTTGAYCIYNNDSNLIGLFIGEDTIKPKDDKKVDVKHISGLTNGLWESETFQKVGYGYLYNGYAVYESVKFNGFIEGFTVPTEAQLYELMNIVEGNGNKLKSKRVDPDIHPRWDAGYVATDDFNLSLVPGGGRGDVNYGFSSIGAALQIYSLSGVYDGELFFIGVLNDGTIIDGVISDLIYGFSMRCIRQLTNDELLLTDGTFLPTVKDYDGNTYQVVKIGNYGWMAQNLATSHYADGTEIPNVTDQVEWDALEEPAYCIYNNNPALPGLYYTDEVINQHIKPKDNKAVRSEHIEGLDNSKWQHKPIEIRSGYLYNWYALEYIANTGWRVPTESDWDALALLIDPNYSKVFGENNYNSLIGQALSLNDRRFWKYMLAETEQAYNGAQFNAVGTGDRSESTGLFNDKRALTRYHSSTIDGSNQISYYTIEVQGYSISESYDNDRFTFGKWDYRSRGMSVRLCRDIEAWEEEISEYDVEMQQYIGNDGKRYKTIRIGNLVWLAENLCETLYNDLTPIPYLEGTTWASLTEGAMCSYANDETNSYLNKEQIQPKNERLINEYDIDKPIYEWLPFTLPITIWRCRKGYNNFGFYKKIEATESFTLSILRFQNGDTGTLRIHNTDSNPITITLSTGFTNKGIGSLSNLASNTHYLLTWVFDGDIFIYRIEQLT